MHAPLLQGNSGFLNCKACAQRFKAPPSPFSGSKGGRQDGNASADAIAAALLQRVAGGNGAVATLREGSDGSDGGWEEVWISIGVPNALSHNSSALAARHAKLVQVSLGTATMSCTGPCCGHPMLHLLQAMGAA